MVSLLLSVVVINQDGVSRHRRKWRAYVYRYWVFPQASESLREEALQ